MDEQTSDQAPLLNPAHEQWVTVREAAQRLGISIISVRRSIRKGALEAELQHGRRGPEYRVRLPAEVAVSMINPAPEHAPDHAQDGDQEPVEPAQAAELLRLVECQQAEQRDLHYELTASAASAAEWRTRAELLDRQVADLKAELERARRPWWRKLLG